MKEIKLKGLQETIYYDECDCGLPILYWVNEKVSGYYMTLSVRYGSLDTCFRIQNEDYEVPRGIAHFLEHINFHEPDGDAQDFFSNNGSDVNAFTTFSYTSYEVYGTNYLKENANHLLDFVLTPCFTDEFIDQEKNIIIEENRMDQDNPGHLLYYRVLQNLFKYDRHREEITGNKEDILKMSKEDILLVYQTFYHPKNMFLIVTGNVNPYEVSTIVKENLQKKTFLDYTNPKRKNKKEPNKVVLNYEEVPANVMVDRLRLAVKIPRKNFKEKNDYKLRLLLSLLLGCNFGPTSLLYEELMNKDLIINLGYEKTIISDYVILYLNAESRYPSELLTILKNALKHLTVDEKTLQRKIHALVSSLVLGFDDITEVNMNLQEQMICYGKVIDDAKDILEHITLADLEGCLKDFSCKEMAVVVLKAKS